MPRRLALTLAALAVAAVACGGAAQPEAVSTAAPTADQAAPAPTTATLELAIIDPTEGAVPPLHPSVDDYPDATIGLEAPDGDRSIAVAVKVAHTSDQRSHGLMEVEDLPDGVGMVFLFDRDRTGGFWMKNTKVPLDIAWADEDGRIVTILQMEPCTADPCPTYDPDEPYRYALEVPKGWFGEVGVTEEWRLALPDGLPAPD